MWISTLIFGSDATFAFRAFLHMRSRGNNHGGCTNREMRMTLRNNNNNNSKNNKGKKEKKKRWTEQFGPFPITFRTGIRDESWNPEQKGSSAWILPESCWARNWEWGRRTRNRYPYDHIVVPLVVGVGLDYFFFLFLVFPLEQSPPKKVWRTRVQDVRHTAPDSLMHLSRKRLIETSFRVSSIWQRSFILFKITYMNMLIPILILRSNAVLYSDKKCCYLHILVARALFFFPPTSPCVSVCRHLHRLLSNTQCPIEECAYNACIRRSVSKPVSGAHPSRILSSLGAWDRHILEACHPDQPSCTCSRSVVHLA